MISRYYTQSNVPAMRKLYILSTKLNMIFALPCIVFLALIPDHTFHFFSQDATLLTKALYILLVGQTFHLISGGVGIILSMSDKSYLHFYNSIFVASVHIVNCYFFIPSSPLVGAATVSAISLCLFNLLRVIQVYYFFRFSFLTKEIFIPLLLAILNTSVLYFAYPLFHIQHHFTMIITSLIVSYVLYFILYSVFLFRDLNKITQIIIEKLARK